MIIVMSLWHALTACAQPAKGVEDSTRSPVEVLPIISYDTDAGLGYGVKSFLLNSLRQSESFDIVLFNSTRGERWYRMVFSIPDFELRQGKAYPWAIDVTVDYDKWISYNFFGLGNASSVGDKETYTREPVELSLRAARGITHSFVAQAGVTYKVVRNFNVATDGRLKSLPPGLNASRAVSASVLAALRYDTRNSFINPSRGDVLQGEAEIAPHAAGSNVSYTRLAAWFQHYGEPFFSHVTLASRLGIQALEGEDIPVQFLLPIGGSGTLRGYFQDRFLDRISVVGNLEARFPIFWRVGGVAGLDAGKVWHSFRQLDLARWATNPVLGLRLYMETFVVRVDAGLGKETTGFYLNFGQLF